MDGVSVERFAARSRRLPTMGPGIRLPRRPVRGGPPARAHKEPQGVQGQGEREDETHARRRVACGSSPTSIRSCAAGLKTSSTPRPRCSKTWTASQRLHAPTPARHPAQAGEAPRLRSTPQRSTAMAQRLLRKPRAVRRRHGLGASETLPMRKSATGEPCAGEPLARFGGRGGSRLPYPYQGRHKFCPGYACTW